MTVRTGRLGWVGVSMEATPGVPVPIVDYIPFLECTLQAKIDVLSDVSARGVRDSNSENSQLGKQWGEGDLKVNLDATLAPYLFYGALGQDTSPASEGNGVYTHTFTTLSSTNAPKTLSLVVNRSGVDQVLHPYSVVNSLELSFSDGLAELKAGIMSKFPVVNTSGTLTTTSGFYYSFRHAAATVGADITAAATGTAYKLRNFTLNIKNTTEPQFVVGSVDPDSIINKNFEVTGSFRVAFEDTTERDAFYNLTKRALIVTLTGNGIGNAMSEFIKLRIYKMRLDENTINLEPDNYVSQEIKFTAEYSSTNTKTLDIQVRNRKSSY